MKIQNMGALALASSLSLSATAGERAWYVAVEGGVSSTEIESTRSVNLAVSGLLGLLPTGMDLSADDGWSMFATVGAKIAENVRLEGELGYRSAEFINSGGIRHTTVIANAMFDLPVLDQLTLSAGVGAGLNLIETDSTPSVPNSFETSGTGFALQGIAALSYQISERVDVNISYRYLNTSVPDNFYATIAGGGVLVDDASASSISVGLRFAL